MSKRGEGFVIDGLSAPFSAESEDEEGHHEHADEAY